MLNDEPVNSLVFETLLGGLVRTATVTSGEEALAFCKANSPDLVLLDLMMPGIGGLEACRLLKADTKLAQIPVIFVTSQSSDSTQNECWKAGCVDFVNKPINGTTLRNRVTSHLQHKLQTDALWTMSLLDGLTGAYNRRLLDSELPKIKSSAERSGAPYSLLMIDVDWFKSYNDTYGHLLGDDCLKSVTVAMQTILRRPTDLLLRYGGEEFLCILPNTDSAGAYKVAESLLTSVMNLKIPHSTSKFQVVTVSIGLVNVQSSLERTEVEWISMADSALYKAKNNGRNCIAVEG